MKDPFDSREYVVSATECTGLMPALPEDHDEDENDARLYAVHDAVTEDKGEKCAREEDKRPR